MIKKWILVAACCLPLGLMAQKGFTVKGKIAELNAPAKAYLSYTINGKEVKDSVLLHKGQFTFKGNLSSTVAAVLVLKHDTITRPKSSKRDKLAFYLENSDITITAKDSVRRGIVKGSATDDDNKTLNAIQEHYLTRARPLMKMYDSWPVEQQKDTTLANPVWKKIDIFQKEYKSAARAFMVSHPDSHISLNVFRELDLDYDFNPDTAALKFARFPKHLKASELGKQIAAIIETSKKTDTGAMAMDFTEVDSIGKPVKLSDFRGQYVLVDFWASWCEPCRAENPNMLAAYNKYKGKNFTILGVSLDDEKSRASWLGAVKYDRLPWMQVSQLKGFKAKSAVLYGVTAIPTNFLVDPSGKIIARNLRGADLDKKLSTLFPM